MPPLGGGEYGPELNDAVFAALQKKIQEQAMQQRAAARGEAASRGIAGSGFEGNRIGAADRGEIQASTDAAVNLALENAARQREERLIQEQRGYQTSERESSQKYGTSERLGSQDFSSGENEKGRKYGTSEREASQLFSDEQRSLQNEYNALESAKMKAFESGQAELVRQFEAQQGDINRAYQAREAQKQRNNDLLAGGIGSAANLAGQAMFAPKAGSLFGTGMAGLQTGTASLMSGGTVPVANGLQLAGSGIGGAGGGGMGLLGSAGMAGAGIVGGAAAGQYLSKLTGHNTNEAKAGSAIGAGLGTVFGPAGSVVGGAVGGLATKAYQGVGKLTGLNKPVNNAVKSVKKIFCFAPDTMVEMADGSLKRIDEIELGDETKGGMVDSLRYSLSTDMHRYKGVRVTGSHAVKQNGAWVRVSESVYASPVEGTFMVVSLVTDEHRIFVDGIEFADEHETDFYEMLNMDQAIDYLNGYDVGVITRGQ